MLDHSVEVLISRDKIEARIKELAKKIEEDYSNEKEPLIIVGLLKGSVIFLSDLVKEINLPLFIDFMSVSSYNGGTESTGVVKIVKDTDFDIKDRKILIVEDIIDTGLTLTYVKSFMMSKGAKEIKVCSLLNKPDRRRVDIKGDYVGFDIPDKFVVGCGLDYDQHYRNLPYIGTVEFKK